MAGTSTAVVHSMDVGWYATRVGVNTGILGCCVGGLNEALVAARGGKRDAYNTAVAAGVTGFLASVQRAPPQRGILVGILCAGLGAGGQVVWEELMKVRQIMSDQRRAELGLRGSRNGPCAGKQQLPANPGATLDDQRSSRNKLFPPMILNKSMGRKDDRDSEAGQTGGERIESGQSSDGNTKDADKGYLMRWIPVKRITDEEVKARKELDRESRMK